MDINKFNNIKEIIYVDPICIHTYPCKHNVTYINTTNETETHMFLGSEIVLMTSLFNFNNYDMNHFITYENITNDNIPNTYVNAPARLHMCKPEKDDSYTNPLFQPSINIHSNPINVKPMDVRTFDEEYEELNKLYEQSKKK